MVDLCGLLLACICCLLAGGGWSVSLAAATAANGGRAKGEAPSSPHAESFSRSSMDDKIQVHVVPHTHDDVGWLKTVDEYYYGANNSIQRAGVQYILDTVVTELSKNPNRTFIYVEIAYFYRWWNEQSNETKELVKKLVSNKQLEFVNAGWCMNDEASTHYNAIVDQMSLGLRFVQENFGDEARPRVAWHIDPFGHSAEQAALFAKMGYDGFFFARIDYGDRDNRLGNKEMELVWRGSPSLGSQSDMFTGILFYGYGPPPDFCFDQGCSDPPIQDDPNLFDYNVDDRVKLFIQRVGDQAIFYNTNNIMMTFGSDFQYQNALQVYKNLDKLIKYVNAEGTVNVFYSTPSRYVDAVHQAGKTWTLKTDDFFPYADNPYAFWTGYFTSRPALKGYTRLCNNYLQVCKQLEASHGGFTGVSTMKLKEAMGVDQHHDAVSGTEKQHVADDYAKRLHIGQVECESLVGMALSDLSAKSSASPPLDFQFCELANLSICPASQTDSFNAVVYNPIGRALHRVAHFPVMSDQLTVIGPDGKEVPSEIFPSSSVTALNNQRASKEAAKFTLAFVDEIPALGFKTYLVRPQSSDKLKAQERRPYVYEHRSNDDIVVDNGAVVLTFDGSTGRVSSMKNSLSGVQVSLDQTFLWWNSSDGHNVNSSQASGAYIFRPNGTSPFNVSEGNVAKVTVVKGEIVTEVRQEFNPWVYQVVRLVEGLPFAEFEFTIGPIPFQDGLGKEVVSRFSTDLDSSSTWYTDANGREMQKRRLNYRPTWKFNSTEPVAGNYYPVNSRIFIRDESKDVQFTVLTDRSQGGSSLNNGQVELMVHRRCLHDDGRGVGEALNETGLVVRGSHFVSLDHTSNATVLHRELGEALMLMPWLALLPSNETYPSYKDKYNMEYAGLTMDLPPQVHLLTLELLGDKKILLRLEHQFQADEPLNTPVNITLDNLFTAFKIAQVTELTLGGNADLSSVHRLQWNTKDKEGMGMGPAWNGNGSGNVRQVLKAPGIVVSLSPMEIHTFEATIE